MTPGPWHEIVGVVTDAGMIGGDVAEGAGVYHALTSGTEMPVYMAVHVNGDPESSAPRLRTIATAVDPTLRRRDLLPLDAVGSVCMLACIVPTRRALAVEPSEALGADG